MTMPRWFAAGMHDIATTVNNSIARWNETVPEERRARIADTFADGATYLDPVQSSRRSPATAVGFLAL
jgi:hypothetical protein